MCVNRSPSHKNGGYRAQREAGGTGVDLVLDVLQHTRVVVLSSTALHGINQKEKKQKKTNCSWGSPVGLCLYMLSCDVPSQQGFIKNPKNS